VIGWRSDVEAVSVEACRRFFDTYYAANNLVIAVVGDFDEADTLARIERAFGPLRAAPSLPRTPTREPEQRGERRAVVEFDVKGPILAAAWHAPAAGHEDADALDVASEILSSGRSSRLYRGLVYEAQQALAAQGAYYEMRDAGIFYAFVSVRPDASIDEAERLLLGEIARLRTEPVTEAELDKAKRGLEVGLLDGLDRSHALALRIASETVTLGRIRSLDERLEGIRGVSVADVQRVAELYLRDDGRSVVRVVAPGEAARP
jgi:predicted Zn-dependent peptidase